MKRNGWSIGFFGFSMVFLLGATAWSDPITLISPNQQQQITFDLSDQIYVSVQYKNQEIIKPSPIGMQLQTEDLGKNPKLGAPENRREVNQVLKPVAPEKRTEIPDHFNELTLKFEGGYGLIARAYDDGVAYRFFTEKEGKIKVVNEQVEFHYPQNDSVYLPITQSMHNSFESNYSIMPLSDFNAGQLAFLPILVDRKDGIKVLLTEADLFDYPGMFVTGGHSPEPVLRGTFSPYPLEEQQKGDRSLTISKEADYIADTDGTRSFPWRVIVPTDHDGSLIENDIVYRLAQPCQLDDTNWIKPGKVAWDWWNALNLFGVDFQAGINTDTYKYYIDFAARYGLQYIILDDGWSNTENLLDVNKNVDLQALVDYGRQKNVGIMVWCIFLTLDKQMQEALDYFQKVGVMGIKVDFMDRDDQKTVNFYWRAAREAAKRHLLVDFHGAYKPTGLRRAYPNVITREGVKGLENNKWTNQPDPEFNTQLPFIRMFAGPMDYTPGATINMPKDDFKPIFNCPTSMGTRCHQMALYVIFESPLQMLADSPSHYLREPDMMDFLAPVPTTWDETHVLDAKVSDYILIARRKGTDWYIGAITDWTPRTLELNLSFLGNGQYNADIFQDGINADHYGSDYTRIKKTVGAGDTLKLDLKSGGGWAARITPKS